MYMYLFIYFLDKRKTKTKEFSIREGLKTAGDMNGSCISLRISFSVALTLETCECFINLWNKI